ncbi:MAG: hypothetical protein NTX79_05935 [Candidatus Micrarchaeota archaeon]|nr:hypothetical protein [Candidatus Micrarchaeota archaeon]
MGRHANMIAFAVVMMLLPTVYASATYMDALNAINSASPVIKGAQSSVDALSSKLTDANRYGISSSSYSASLNSAQSLLQQARSADFSASNEFASAQYDSVVNDETSAQNYAAQAKSTADTATNALTSILNAPLSFDVTPDQTSLQMADGDSMLVMVRLASTDNRKLDCGYLTSQTPLQQLGVIPPSGMQTFQVAVQAPASGNGTMQFIVSVECTVGSYMTGDRSASISVSYQPDPVKLAINQANQSIGSAQSWIGMADRIISNATDIGMDTRDEIAAVATSKGLLESAKDYLQLAQADQVSNSAEQAKSDADKANGYAKQAEDKARQAYESLNSNIETCQTAYRQMLSAKVEISDADGIYTKLASIVKSLPQEMNAGAAASDVEAQRQKLDGAKNENSQAKTQLSAGYCEQSVNSSMSARNDAADANNQLGRVAERMKDTIVGALDAASLSAQGKVDAAKNAYSSAGATFGANAAKITQAQEQLIGAQSALPSAQQAVQDAKQSTQLSDFLDKSAYALTALQNVGSEADKSAQLANSATNDAYATYAVVIAGAVCALGIGFLFWKRKRAKKDAGDKYRKAAENYAKQGKFDKAAEIYRKLHKKKRR